MKNILLIIGLLAPVLSVSCQDNTHSDIKEIINFNFGWKFHLGAIDCAIYSDLEDSDWRDIQIPHDWSIEGEKPFKESNPTTDRGGYVSAGIGWYRKKFEVDKKYIGKKVLIEFGGVYMNCEIWANGSYVGKQIFGYNSFTFDITEHLKFGNENLISVKVDNSIQPNSRWYTGSGIYRSVKLIICNYNYIPPHGIYVTTPQISKDLSKVDIEAKVCHNDKKNEKIRLLYKIINTAGERIDSFSCEKYVKCFENPTFKSSILIKNPKLWSCNNPYLYKIRAEIYIDHQLQDFYETYFGIRDIHFDANRGFILNDSIVKIKGVCLHHDAGPLGAAFYIEAAQRQINKLKKIGCNAIRFSHNPPAEEYLDLCDRNGILVMDEIFDEWISRAKAVPKGSDWYSYSCYFIANYKKDLQNFIVRDRNHPSIILWSVGNEIPEQNPDESFGKGNQILNSLIDICHNLDNTRPVTVACNNIIDANSSGFADQLDVVGYNYMGGLELIRDLKGKGGIDFKQIYKNEHKKFPNRKMIASETPSSQKFEYRGNYFLPGEIDPRDSERKRRTENNMGQSTGAIYCMEALRDTFLAGEFIWTGWDYIGEPSPYKWPNKSSSFGIVDLCGFPKDGYYFYQSKWSEKPMVYFYPHWNWPGHERQIIPVECYTNCDSIELILNGKSLGSRIFNRTNQEKEIWNVPYQPGIIKLLGYQNGKIAAIKQVTTSGSAFKLKMASDQKSIKADGESICYIETFVLDSLNNIVPKADNKIEYIIHGPGKIIGVGNGNPECHEAHKANKRSAFNGKCLLIIQSKRIKGEIQVEAKADGLTSGFLTIRSL